MGFTYDYSLSGGIDTGDPNDNTAIIGKRAADSVNQIEIYPAGRIVALDGVATKVKAGVPADGDFATTATSGLIAVDSTNNRIYVRVGSTWKYAALT